MWEWVWFIRSVNGCECGVEPVEMNCRMSVTSVQWSPDGSQVALGGSQTFQEGKGISCVQFYSCCGKVRTSI